MIGKTVNFENCSLSENLTFTITGSHTDSASATYGGTINFRECMTGLATSPLYNRVTILGTLGRVSAEGCYQRGGLSYLNKQVTDFDLNHQNRSSRDGSIPMKMEHIKPAYAVFPKPNDTTTECTLELPLGAIIKKIFAIKPTTTASSADYQLKVGWDDKTVLGQSTLGAFNNEHTIKLQDLNIVTSVGKNKIRIWAEGTSTASQSGGLAIIEYY